MSASIKNIKIIIMTLKSLKAAVKKLNKEQGAVIKANKALTKLGKKARSIEVKSVHKNRAIRKKIKNKSWKVLKNDSKKGYKAYSKMLNDLVSFAGTRNKAISNRDILEEKLAPHIKPVTSIKQWGKRKEQLKGVYRKKGMPADKISRIIKNLENTDLNKYNKLYKQAEAHKNLSINNSFNSLLRVYMYSYYSYCCSQTNMNKSNKITISSIRAKISSAEKNLAKQLKSLKSLQGNNVNINASCKATEKILTDNIEKILIPLALELYKRKTPGKKQFNDIMDLSLRTGTAIRKSFLILAACKRLRFYYAGKYVTGDLKRWDEGSKVRSLEVSSKAKAVSFGSLAAAGSSFSKKQITLKGRVLRVEIRHVRKKPISHAFITNGKYVVAVTIPHIKIDSGGMTPGSYVEITGQWQQRNKEAFNKQSLAADRIDHTKLSASSWISWLTLEMNDVYQIMPHSLNASLSWKPGRSGAINSIKFSTL